MQAEVLETLGMAFQALEQLRQQLVNGAPALELEASYSSLYGFLWQTYKDRFQKALRQLGVDFGFFWERAERFEEGAAALVAKQPEYASLVELMRKYRENFHDALGYYRNHYLEHRDAKIDQRMLDSFHELGAAESTFENVWLAIEAIVAGVVVANLPPHMQLVEVAESERDLARPDRFRIRFAQLRAKRRYTQVHDHGRGAALPPNEPVCSDGYVKTPERAMISAPVLLVRRPVSVQRREAHLGLALTL